MEDRSDQIVEDSATAATKAYAAHKAIEEAPVRAPFRDHIPSKSTAGLVVACLALFVSLGGVGYASKAIRQISGSQIKKGSIQLDRLSTKARAGLTGPAGPGGPIGEAGMAGSPGTNGTNGKDGKDGTNGRDGTNGTDGTSLFNAPSIPSGTTVRGAWGGRYMASLGGTHRNSFLLVSSFPLPAPFAVTDGNVQFGANTAAPVDDPDPACTGTVDTPTAPAGKVGVYVNEATRENVMLAAFKLTAAGVLKTADRYGFEVRIVDVDAGADAMMRAEGT